MTFMRQAKVRDVLLSARALLFEQRYEDVASVLHNVVFTGSTTVDWSGILKVLEAIPKGQRQASAAIAVLYARALAGSQQFTELLGFVNDALPYQQLEYQSRLRSDQAYALLRLQRYQEAHDALRTALPHLMGQELGVALSRLGLVSFSLSLPWEDCFQQSRGLLSGRMLGLVLLDYGYCLNQSMRGTEARSLYQQALPLFKQDP